ncbi:hypothetical protein BGM19_02765 [Streptomyces agglomeratus]|uniref:Uncharacterized protein n=1 Tax=Streptomyces agglomeratus TaxID=285458 RepID=A0A1E5PGN8_9ACTN|nr:hypothetical protein [Streptomyces agglomeratus]OEJ28713.1 hypothetical protein AS594_33875 [Streptomyces agglomeratus]OEJ49772.1 hypothetical protein BGK72_02210 [Streptomyces agglomeratus]OEJ57075.1 hypothetical protein BGM19_02765 [Streptomyces agglomeratus]
MARVRRIVAWTTLAVVATGLGTYFAVVGLEAADQTASVVGLFVAVASLALTVSVELRARRRPVPAGGEPEPPAAPAPLRTDGAQQAGDHIDFSGGVFHGNVIGKQEHRRPVEGPDRSDMDAGEAGHPS